MTYDITTKTAPAMPKLGKGLDFVKLVLSQVSPDMREPIAPTLLMLQQLISVQLNFCIQTNLGRNFVA